MSEVVRDGNSLLKLCRCNQGHSKCGRQRGTSYGSKFETHTSHETTQEPPNCCNVKRATTARCLRPRLLTCYLLEGWKEEVNRIHAELARSEFWPSPGKHRVCRCKVRCLDSLIRWTEAFFGILVTSETTRRETTRRDEVGHERGRCLSLKTPADARLRSTAVIDSHVYCCQGVDYRAAAAEPGRPSLVHTGFGSLATSRNHSCH